MNEIERGLDELLQRLNWLRVRLTPEEREDLENQITKAYQLGRRHAVQLRDGTC